MKKIYICCSPELMLYGATYDSTTSTTKTHNNKHIFVHAHAHPTHLFNVCTDTLIALHFAFKFCSVGFLCRPIHIARARKCESFTVSGDVLCHCSAFGCSYLCINTLLKWQTREITSHTNKHTQSQPHAHAFK